jgi:hypothetical protein
MNTWSFYPIFYSLSAFLSTVDTCLIRTRPHFHHITFLSFPYPPLIPSIRSLSFSIHPHCHSQLDWEEGIYYRERQEEYTGNNTLFRSKVGNPPTFNSGGQQSDEALT